ncbi:MAG: transposase [Myxococcota bacterium]|nr:transposase [Myxococcota bacterium]
MPRRARLHSIQPGHPHHLVLRGNNRRQLFTEHVARELFLEYLGDASRRWSCPLHALTLMDNHVHLVTTPPTLVAMSKFVQSFAQRYAQRRNRLRGGSGRLFEERFYAECLRDEAHMAATIPYVELNPERAGIVASPDQYAWSTYHLHALGPERSRIPASLWTPCDWYLGLASTDEARRATYREWFGMRRGQDVPNGEVLRELEMASDRYTRRLRRPDGTRAAEDELAYGSGLPYESPSSAK